MHALLTLTLVEGREHLTGRSMIGRAFKRLWNDKRGNALILAGAALPMVVGSAGLASDTIQWALWKRQLQRAADSAALAGVYDRIARDGATTNVSAAVADDMRRHNHAKAALLGAPVIDHPAGPNWTNPVKVTLNIQERLGFSSFFMSTPPIIAAEATAATVRTGAYCVVSLIDTGATGIKATGSATIKLGCGMITNSTSLSAAIAGGSSSITASPVAAVGGIGDGNWGSADLLPFTVKQPDPFKDVEVPDFTACKGNGNKIFIPNQNDTVDRESDTGVQCVSDIDVNGRLKLGSATYVIDGGSFAAKAQANISCTGCTIMLTNSDSDPSPTIGGVDIAGTAKVNMTAPTSGLYEGLLFYQDRRAPKGENIVNKINGNATSLLGGAFYFPNQQLQINGNAGLKISCARFVSYVVEFAGDGTLTNQRDAACIANPDPDFMGRHVRLVA